MSWVEAADYHDGGGQQTVYEGTRDFSVGGGLRLPELPAWVWAVAIGSVAFVALVYVARRGGR